MVMVRLWVLVTTRISIHDCVTMHSFGGALLQGTASQSSVALVTCTGSTLMLSRCLYHDRMITSLGVQRHPNFDAAASGNKDLKPGRLSSKRSSVQAMSAGLSGVCT